MDSIIKVLTLHKKTNIYGTAIVGDFSRIYVYDHDAQIQTNRIGSAIHWPNVHTGLSAIASVLV